MPTPFVICYTSKSSISLPSPTLEDQEYTLADLPVTSLQLYAAAVDTGDGAATFTYAWIIDDKPAGSTATLSSASAQNPTLNSINAVWGNIRLRCVATSSTGRVSESRRLYAPDSAFVHVRVRSNDTYGVSGLELPAKWERNWQVLSRNWAKAVQFVYSALKGQTIEQHAGVSVATGAMLDQLCSGGYATMPGPITLHKHTGDTVARATQAAPGTVRLDVAAANIYDPGVLNEEVTAFTARFDAAANSNVQLWYCHKGATVKSFDILMLDSGAGTGTNTFSLAYGTAAEWIAGTQTVITASTTAIAPAANATREGHPALAPDYVIPAGNYLGVLQQTASSSPGAGVNVTATMLRRV